MMMKYDLTSAKRILQVAAAMPLGKSLVTLIRHTFGMQA